MPLRSFARRLSTGLQVFGLFAATATAADSGWILVGSGPAEKDRAEVRAYKPDKTLALQLFPFDDFKKPPAMEIAAGDVNGDGRPELILACGRQDKNAAVVRAFDLKKAGIWELQPYADLKKDDDQIAVAAGDLDGDGTDELIVGEASDSNGPNRLRVFRFQDGSLRQAAEFLIADLKNIAVAAGDLDGDGRAEVLVANLKAAGKGADIRVLRAQTEGGWKLIQSASFNPGPAKQGFRIAAGDINGDKKDEILLAFEPTGKDDPSCLALDGSGKLLLALAAPFKHKNHLRVSAVDLNADGKEEILLAHVKPEGESEPDDESGLVRVYSGDGKPFGFEVGTSFRREINVAGLGFDITPPVLTFSEPLNGDIVPASPLKIKGNASEPLKFVRLEGEPPASPTPVQALLSSRKDFEGNLPIPKAVSHYKVIAQDRSGNETVVRRSVIYEEPGPLTVKITSPVAGAVLNFASVTVRGIVNKPTSIVILNGTRAFPNMDGSFYVPAVPVQVGGNLIYAVARDFYGNKSEDFLTFSADANLTSNVQIIPSITVGQAPLTVSFQIQINPSVKALKILWSRTGAPAQSTLMESVSGLQETYTEPGFYRPILQIQDQKGEIHASSIFLSVQDTYLESQILNTFGAAMRKDRQGRIWVLDSQGTFVVWDPTTRSSKTIRIASPNGTITGGTALAIDENGTVYVVDSKQKKIHAFNSDGVWQKTFGNDKITEPSAIAAGDCSLDCRVFVADSSRNLIVVFDSSGKYIEEIGSIGDATLVSLSSRSVNYTVKTLDFPRALRSQFGLLFIMDRSHTYMTLGGHMSAPFVSVPALDVALLPKRRQSALLLPNGREIKIVDDRTLADVARIGLHHTAQSIEAADEGDRLWYTGPENTFEVAFKGEDPRSAVERFLKSWQEGDLQAAAELISVHGYHRVYPVLLSPIKVFRMETGFDMNGDTVSIRVVIDGEPRVISISKDEANHWSIYDL